MHSLGFITFLNNIGVEDTFWGLESWHVYINNLSIGELVSFLEFGGLGSLCSIGGWVKGNEAEVFLDLSDNLSPG